MGRAQMSALSTDAIRYRLREADPPKRLVISPLLDESEQLKKGQASVDVRLGPAFSLVTASSIGAITEFPNPAPFSQLYRREYVPLGAKIVIHPHQFMLAHTLEYLKLPSDLMAYVVGRSTWGRLGLIVATAIGVHPGFAGCITFELRNLGETPLVLYPGQTIAQLFFHTVVDRDGQSAAEAAVEAQYSGTLDIAPQKISSKRTHKTLGKLIKRFDRLSRP